MGSSPVLIFILYGGVYGINLLFRLIPLRTCRSFIELFYNGSMCGLVINNLFESDYSSW